MEIIQYLRLIRHWLWLLILTGIIGGSIAFIIRVQQPQTYRAQALIAIGGFIQSPNPDQQEIRIGLELTETYAQLVRTDNVLQSTLAAVDVPIDVKELDELLETRILPNTSLLQLSLAYPDPILSADIVNELARQVILASPSNLTPELQAQIDLLNEQITSVTKEITDLRGQVATLDTRLESDRLSGSRREELQAQRSTLIDQINQSSSNIAQFTNTIASLQQRTNSVEIVEPANIPDEPISKNTVSITILSIVITVSVVFGLIVIFEYVNDTFHLAEEVTQTLQIPLLGVISHYGKRSDSFQDKLLTENARSRLLDEFSILRTNLLFSNDKSINTYLITSASPGEGKSLTVSNLAISMSLAGLRVLLIDADLRRPRLHEIFNIDNSDGLASLLTLVPSTSKLPAGQGSGKTQPLKVQLERIRGASQDTFSPNRWKQFVRTTDFENLRVITSGQPVDNPTELLGSAILQRWIEIIKDGNIFDVILIDSPPVLGFPDATVISASMDAKVLLIIEASKTRRSSALQTMERFGHVNTTLFGAILNQANLREDGYYGNGSYKKYYRSLQQE